MHGVYNIYSYPYSYEYMYYITMTIDHGRHMVICSSLPDINVEYERNIEIPAGTTPVVLPGYA